MNFRALACLVPAVFTVMLLSCASTADKDRITKIKAPELAAFDTGGVNLFLQRRCGTLDCHGQRGRALRIYGQYGLRSADAGTDPLGVTTADEVAQNYRSVVSLEPEELSRVIANRETCDTDDPPCYLRLLLMLKAIGYRQTGDQGVQHKGGSLISPRLGDNGYDCLRLWLLGLPLTNSNGANVCSAAAAEY